MSKRRSFKKFRAKLADEVTLAVNAFGRRITEQKRSTIASRYCCCPLGVRGAGGLRFPLHGAAADMWSISKKQSLAFINGFDGRPRSSAAACSKEPRFFALGRAYRRRFVEGVKRDTAVSL